MNFHKHDFYHFILLFFKLFLLKNLTMRNLKNLTMRNLIKPFSYIVFLLIAFSCNNNGNKNSAHTDEAVNNTPLGQASVVDEISDPNILQVAIGSEDHSLLVAAVQAAKIEHILVNAGPLTVFAPVNNAFESLPEGVLDNLLKPENINDLLSILLRHSAPGTYSIQKLKNEIKKGRKLYMANGDYLDLSIQNENVYINDSKIIQSIITSNGVINVVDKVIL